MSHNSSLFLECGADGQFPVVGEFCEVSKDTWSEQEWDYRLITGILRSVLGLMASPSLQVRETVAKMYHRRGAEEATIRNVLKPKIYLISCCSTKPGTYPITINQCRFALTTDGDEG